jgi:hypothetical protein
MPVVEPVVGRPGRPDASPGSLFSELAHIKPPSWPWYDVSVEMTGGGVSKVRKISIPLSYLSYDERSAISGVLIECAMLEKQPDLLASAALIELSIGLWPRAPKLQRKHCLRRSGQRNGAFTTRFREPPFARKFGLR